MQTSKRAFFMKLGLTGLSLLSWPKILTAANQKRNARKNINVKSLTILFQGDSITDGGRSRNADWNHIMGHGYAYLIASRLWYDYPKEDLMLYNRGVSGNKIKDLQETLAKGYH